MIAAGSCGSYPDDHGQVDSEGPAFPKANHKMPQVSITISFGITHHYARPPFATMKVTRKSTRHRGQADHNSVKQDALREIVASDVETSALGSLGGEAGVARPQHRAETGTAG